MVMDLVVGSQEFREVVGATGSDEFRGFCP